MTFNIELTSQYANEKEARIEKIIASRPAWDSVHKPVMQIANFNDVKKGDLLYWKSRGYLAEFVGMVYTKTGYTHAGIIFHEGFGSVEEAVIYTYRNLDGFYKVPYMWIDNTPVYDGMPVYGKYNDEKYIANEGWLIPDNHHEYCSTLIHENTDTTAYTLRPPKKEYWVAFVNDSPIEKVGTIGEVRELVRILEGSADSENAKYVKIDI